MQNANIISWKRNEENKIILLISVPIEQSEKVASDVPITIIEKQFEIELPNTIIDEIIRSTNQTFDEQERINEILKQIYDIIEKRALNVSHIADELNQLSQDATKIAEEIDKAQTKLDVLKATSKLKTIDAKRGSIDKKRHLNKLLIQEEGKLRVRLERLKRGLED